VFLTFMAAVSGFMVGASRLKLWNLNFRATLAAPFNPHHHNAQRAPLLLDVSLSATREGVAAWVRRGGVGFFIHRLSVGTSAQHSYTNFHGKRL
jgi:hypothetical protein